MSTEIIPLSDDSSEEPGEGGKNRPAFEILDALARRVVEQMMPSATEVRARCAQCEYRNFCGDVF